MSCHHIHIAPEIKRQDTKDSISCLCVCLWQHVFYKRLMSWKFKHLQFTFSCVCTVTDMIQMTVNVPDSMPLLLQHKYCSISCVLLWFLSLSRSILYQNLKMWLDPCRRRQRLLSRPSRLFRNSQTNEKSRLNSRSNHCRALKTGGLVSLQQRKMWGKFLQKRSELAKISRAWSRTSPSYNPDKKKSLPCNRVKKLKKVTSGMTVVTCWDHPPELSRKLWL